jgi:hypothetical protein
VAARRVMRAKFASVQDGYSAESIEDMLVAWAAAWEGDPGAHAHLARLRTDATLEPLLAALWTLRLSKDELAVQRAQKAITESADGPMVVALALRDPQFHRVSLFTPTPETFSLWLSTLVTGRGPRLRLARGLVELWVRDTSTYSAELGWQYHRVLDEKRSAELSRLARGDRVWFGHGDRPLG